MLWNPRGYQICEIICYIFGQWWSCLPAFVHFLGNSYPVAVTRPGFGTTIPVQPCDSSIQRSKILEVPARYLLPELKKPRSQIICNSCSLLWWFEIGRYCYYNALRWENFLTSSLLLLLVSSSRCRPIAFGRIPWKVSFTWRRSDHTAVLHNRNQIIRRHQR